MTVWIYVDTAKQVGDRNHLKVFSSEDDPEKWFAANDPEGVAFEYRLRAQAKAARRAVCEFWIDARVGPDHPLGPQAWLKSNIRTIRGENPHSGSI
jgi:hypothetical protein